MAARDAREPAASTTSPTTRRKSEADDAGAVAKPPPRKRRRIVISCTECHRRKQKCDRNLPCANCIVRGKRDACKYDTSAPTMKDQHAAVNGNGNGAEEADSPDSTGRLDSERVDDNISSKVPNFGYSQTDASTLGFLRKIDGTNPAEPLSRLAKDSVGGGDHSHMRERYKSLVRQLPARTYVDKLVDIYFYDFNWQYYGVERDVFDKQLAGWHDLPLDVFTVKGPQALPPDLRAFPALLFQVLATALLVLPSPGSDPTFDALKYAGNMTFEDLAMDYSELGVSILSLLGKREMSVATVQAGFLRAAFLKYVALVTEAWHAIGSAIRDAQEIGLHRDSLDPKPAGDHAEAVLENQWEIQRRRKLWMILVSWDIHTGVVLGRPTTINLNLAPPTLPVDAPLPNDCSKTPVLPRTENDPPTPLTRSLWAYRVMSRLGDILELDKDGPCPKDFSKVDHIHRQLLELEDSTPAYFRLVNPDKRFDELPECYWIPYVRANLPQLLSFNRMALHRPYIFTRPASRTEALKSSLAMLNAQRMHFQSLRPEQYKTFSLFFGTFDAIVLMASIYILFPKEHRDLVDDATQHVTWAVERFEAMSDRNALAKSALGVLQAICIRLNKVLGTAQRCTPAETPAIPVSNSTDSTNESTTTAFTTPNSSSLYTTTSASAPIDPALQPSSYDGWLMPSDFDWSSIAPIYATGDLVYNDLAGFRDRWAPETAAAAAAPSMDPANGGAQPWQFEGDFGDDSVWNLFNQFTPI